MTYGYPPRRKEPKPLPPNLPALEAALVPAISAEVAANAIPSTKDGEDTYKVVTRRLEFNDTAGGKGSQLNFNHRANGSGQTTTPAAVDVHNHPGARSAIVVHQYSDNERAVQIDNTATKPALEIHNTQNTVLNPGFDGTGDFILLRDHGTSILRIDKDLVFRVGGTKVPTFLHTAAKALSVQTSSGFNGEAMDITKAGTGAGTALKISNSGTGASLLIRNAAADVARINADGEVEILANGKGILARSADGTRYRLTPPNGGGAATWVAAP